MSIPAIANVRADAFPPHIPLRGILRNDARIVSYQPGDIVCREGDYGSSAFLILSGAVRVVLSPSLPRAVLGRQPVHKKGFFGALSQLWTNSRAPEVRDIARYRDIRAQSRGESGTGTHIFLQDVPGVLDHHRTISLPAGQIFGELAALGRVAALGHGFRRDRDPPIGDPLAGTARIAAVRSGLEAPHRRELSPQRVARGAAGQSAVLRTDARGPQGGRGPREIQNFRQFRLERLVQGNAR